MAESVIGTVSQSSLIVLDSSKFGFRTCATPSTIIRLHQSSIENRRFLVSSADTKHLKPISAVSSDFKASSLVTDNVDLSSEGIEIEPVTGGGGDGYGDSGGSGGGGGGGGGAGGGDRKDKGEGENGGERKKKMALSMSQKLTLGYAALVGMGGAMGYLKSGSQKSLLAGGLSASVLYYVYTQLPTNPVYASSIGLGVSSVLLGVMGSRFLRSKKVFPAGVVSLVSLVMTGGYIHGVLRSMH
ncbi:protein FATTY ACID EXPORT 2, chloroplastic [Ricinus communis]|uniref:Transmembrane protein 14, putative n=1 Tax=Ricinus communis TaxID=3988 RepID=B9RR06_RICCO|nr:protein FATTY ACID EXPORT 2, chloroplastic [Ricinus communis]EEF46177.1 transmembrane protein 14, putative [Ricinus communis]|eukprot:XP_002516175.1 protein FATTY ACID EXPORT 2, chloroplastic [Ricinus communis]